MKSQAIVLLTLLTVPSIVAFAQESGSQVLGICDVLKNLPDYRHKRITVRGEFGIGGHQYFLWDPDCATPWTSEGYTWPSMLVLGVLNVPPELDPEKIRAVLEGLNEQLTRVSQASGDDARIIVTCVAWVETHADFTGRVHRLSDADVRTEGYGQSSSAPGELFVEKIIDVHAEPGKKEEAKGP